MAEIDQMCLPPFNETPSTIMLAMNIILEPMNGVKRKDFYTLYDIIFTIYDKTKHKMTMLISKDAMIHNIKGSLHFKTDHEITNFDTSTAFKLQNLQNVKVHIQFLINYSENELLTTILDFALGFTNISNYSNIFKAKFNNFSHLDENERLSNGSCSNNLNRPLFQICVSQSNKENTFHFELLWNRQKLSFDSFTLIVLEPEPFCPRVALPKQCCSFSGGHYNCHIRREI
ncbi:uncharacterized protein LOC132739635 isoform X2 [Ruditapes philippinarum]|uniref:uncharacterized protein LOC132739635 isoform X2 n=1 Tax=Ruditapes philippinarum TaxID=129788 RepID=UPI00295B3644|nr:uncharacterized protein LOC132739635 isoform X2 [Ruditapes philippinarum]